MKRMLRSLLGLLTLAAAGAGIWYLFRLLDPAASRHGELLLQVRFPEAGNLVEGAPVRTRGVAVGEVRSLDLSPDGTGVLVRLAIERQQQGLVRTDSRFWIVRPRFEGITRGVEGLDTLLRNPYVVFDTPGDGEMKPVSSGMLLVGLPAPPAGNELPPLAAEDLVLSVRFARSFGVESGAPVLLRDIRVGEVRAVELDPSGQWSNVQVAVRERFRRTVRTNSIFWIQKPSVQSGWLASNIRAEELGTILTGPSVAYFTPEGDSEPLQRGAVLRGTTEPPPVPETLAGPIVYVPPKSSSEASRLAEAAQQSGAALAGVSYAFEELGVFRNRRYVREGTAVLVRAGGRLLALTSRSLCDGRYVVSDFFSRADIEAEQWKVRGGSGWLSDAMPLWTAPEGADLALLELRAELGGAALELGPLAGRRLDPGEGLQLVAFRGEAEPEFVLLPPQTAAKAPVSPGVYPLEPEYARTLERWEGALVLDASGQPVGLVGRTKALSAQPALVSFELLSAYELARGAAQLQSSTP